MQNRGLVTCQHTGQRRQMTGSKVVFAMTRVHEQSAQRPRHHLHTWGTLLRSAMAGTVRRSVPSEDPTAARIALCQIERLGRSAVRFGCRATA